MRNKVYNAIDNMESLWIFTFILLFILLFNSISFPLLYIVKYESAKKLIITELNKPVNIIGTVRVTPLAVAYTNGLDSLSLTTHSIDMKYTSIGFDKNGHIIIGWLIEPSGFINSLTNSGRGALLLNISVYPPKRTYLETKFSLNHRPFLFSRKYFLRWKVLGKKPLYEDLLIVRKGNENKATVYIPVMSWKLGFLYSIPVLDSYIKISPNGDINILNVEDAERKFQGDTLYYHSLLLENIWSYLNTPILSLIIVLQVVMNI